MSKIFTNLSSMDIEKAIRKEMSGLSFEDGKSELQSMKNFFTTLEDLNVDNFYPDAELQTVKKQYDKFLELVNQLSNFDYHRTDTNIAQERQNLLNSITHQYGHIFNIEKMMLPYLYAKNHKYDEIFKKINESYQGIREQEKNINKVAKDSQEALDSIKTTTGDAVSLYYSKVFAIQASEHDGKAQPWFWSAVISGVVLLLVLIGWLYFALSGKIKTDDWYNMMPILISKGLIISVLYLALHQCIKNYKTHRHLYILNKHRDNALKTFEAFVNASSKDKDVRDTLLTIAAKSIYNINKTGYLSKEEQGNFNLTLNDIMKHITPK
tara:strand:+ start:241 stop:1212 length:972 start_codon:yes stop_codon:yes gene_type:complete